MEGTREFYDYIEVLILTIDTTESSSFSIYV